MANIWEESISILAGNLNSGRSYLITTVTIHFSRSSTPSNDLQNLRLASCSNLLRSPSSSTTSGSSFMSPMPPPSMPHSHPFIPKAQERYQKTVLSQENTHLFFDEFLLSIWELYPYQKKNHCLVYFLTLLKLFNPFVSNSRVFYKDN